MGGGGRAVAPYPPPPPPPPASYAYAIERILTFQVREEPCSDTLFSIM